MFVYRHSDMAHLQQLLAASSAARKLVITDSLFSMDGDFAPLKYVCTSHLFLLYVLLTHTHVLVNTQTNKHTLFNLCVSSLSRFLSIYDSHALILAL